VGLCDSPGLYDAQLPAARKVSYHQSFGGRPINLPDVTQHSTIDANTDKVCDEVFSADTLISFMKSDCNTELYSRQTVPVATDEEISLQRFLIRITQTPSNYCQSGLCKQA